MNESNFITRLVNEITLNPNNLVKEIISRYRSEDFKKVIFDISKKTKLSKAKLVQLFCEHTGTTSDNLPGGYSLIDFLHPSQIKKPDKDVKMLPVVPVDIDHQ